jgi:hypothetical protein
VYNVELDKIITEIPDKRAHWLHNIAVDSVNNKLAIGYQRLSITGGDIYIYDLKSGIITKKLKVK